MSTTQDIRELNRAYDIYDPWIPTTTEREPWALTLTSGTQVELWIPLGAAVELEEAGFQIVSAR
jgi:hypothetical protein